MVSWPKYLWLSEGIMITLYIGPQIRPRVVTILLKILPLTNILFWKNKILKKYDKGNKKYINRIINREARHSCARDNRNI